MKSEPSAYSWDDFIQDQSTYWDGVRNYQARNNMRAMEKGDLVLFYRSVKDPSVIGIAEIVDEASQDPTTKDDRWSAVGIKVVKPLNSSVSLSDIKARKGLSEMRLVKQSRLSVAPVTKKEFDTVLRMGKTEL